MEAVKSGQRPQYSRYSQSLNCRGHSMLTALETVTIRNAVPEDRPILVAMSQLLAREVRGAELKPAFVQAGIRAVFEIPALQSRYMVAELDGSVIGQLLITREWDDQNAGFRWRIRRLYIHIEYRRCGTATAMLRHVILQAANAGALEVRASVHKWNYFSQKVFKREGFIGEGIDFTKSMRTYVQGLR